MPELGTLINWNLTGYEDKMDDEAKAKLDKEFADLTVKIKAEPLGTVKISELDMSLFYFSHPVKTQCFPYTLKVRHHILTSLAELFPYLKMGTETLENVLMVILSDAENTKDDNLKKLCQPFIPKNIKNNRLAMALFYREFFNGNKEAAISYLKMAIKKGTTVDSINNVEIPEPQKSEIIELFKEIEPTVKK